MRGKFFLKFNLFLIAISVIMFVLDIHILQDGLFNQQIKSAPPMRKSPIAAMQIQQKKTKEQMAITNFSFVARSNSSKFIKNSPIDFSCIIQNTSDQSAAVSALIRTPSKEIASARDKMLKPSEKITLKGEFMPQTTGLLYAACRTDGDAKITALYIRE